jgi:hypothetical protein
MSKITRRRMLSVAGLSLGGGLVASQSGRGTGATRLEAATSDGASQGRKESRPRYVPIAPEEAAARAYQVFAEGGCMYATVKGIVTLVAEKDPAAVPPFFFDMFKYGAGGCGKWGTLCGACNGSAAVVGLFHQESAVREALIAELFRWYETAELPTFTPPGGKVGDFPRSSASSVLCHVSVDRWCKKAKADPLGSDCRERCRRLTADVAAKVVGLLNARHAADTAGEKVTAAKSPAPPADAASGPPESCIQCHCVASEEKEAVATKVPKSIARMDCSTCHDMKGVHPD